MSRSFQFLLIRIMFVSVILVNVMFILWYSLPDHRYIISGDRYLFQNANKREIDYYYNGYDPRNNSYNQLASIFNESNVTLANRKLRRPYSHQCDTPAAFPRSPPRAKRLNRICSNLDFFKIKCNLSEQTCESCLPPNGGGSWGVDVTKKFQARELDTRERRRKEIKNIIEKQMVLEHDESSILLLTLNQGYNYLFLNWLCGLEMLGIASNIRDSTLIIATDEESERLARRLDFLVIRGDWIRFHIDQSAAEVFGLGPHRWAVSLQIIYTLDVLSLGYNVIQQDVDVVWLKDVRNYFDNSFLDIEMPCDGRVDRGGPANTGFIHLRSNCKTLVFVETLIQYIGLTLIAKSDQRLWNMFLMEYDFRQMLFELLPPDKFTGGHQWGNGFRRGKRERISDHVWLLHASWTETHPEKITKFKMLQAWFLNETCPYYQDGIIPEHKEPYTVLVPNKRTWTFPDPKEQKWW